MWVAKYKVVAIQKTKEVQQNCMHIIANVHVHLLSVQNYWHMTFTRMQVSLHEHHILTRALISECSKDKDEKEGDNHMWNWSGELCRDSERLLQYHGSLTGLNKLQLVSV